jgi:hypothetical protein
MCEFDSYNEGDLVTKQWLSRTQVELIILLGEKWKMQPSKDFEWSISKIVTICCTWWAHIDTSEIFFLGFFKKNL